MITKRLHNRSALSQAWIEMENAKYPEGKRSMVLLKKKSKTATGNAGLCMELKEPADKLSAYTIWLHGPAGIGKTSLSAMFPQSHLFCAGGQAKALKARYVILNHWQHFASLVDQFKTSSFRTATIDLVEVVYDMCFEHVLNELNIDYPGKTSSGKDDYGKSWFFIRKEFAKVIAKLMSLEDEQGLIFISNSIFGERMVEEGSTVEDVHPNLSARPLNFIAGAVDIIGFYTQNTKGERELIIRPKPGLMAKCRLDHRFKYTDSSPVQAIPMGNSKEEAYANFMLAFDNKLVKKGVSPVIKKRVK